MSTYYHEPIETGESNSPATINTRLSGLDGGITSVQDQIDALVIGSGTSQAETIAARTGINYKSGTPPAALATSVRYAASDIYNVLAYGAIGNGVTDDRAAIQAAIDAATAAGGGVVFLPRGTYYLTSSGGTCLTLHNNITLRGAGPQSILDFHGAADDHCVYLNDTVDGAVETLLIQNTTTATAGSAIASTANTSRMRVRSVQIRGNAITKVISAINSASGTMTVTASNHGFSTFDTVYIYATGTTGELTSLDGPLQHITVLDANTFSHGATQTNTAATGVAQKMTWFNGIWVQGTDSVIEGCDIQTGIYSSIRLSGSCARNTVQYCTLGGGAIRGVMFDNEGGSGAAYNIVAHNHFDALKGLISKIESTAAHNILCDNIMTDCGNGSYNTASTQINGPYSTFERNSYYFTAPATDAAIDCATNPGHLTIRDNIIEGHLGIGINIRGSATTQTEVSGNVISGGTYGINFSGGQSLLTIARNRISSVSACGINLHQLTNFVVQHNTIVAVSAGPGISINTGCTYGSLTGNMISNTNQDGITILNSSPATKFISIVGNVINDVGNSGSGYNVFVVQNTEHLAVVGNVCDDTPETSSVRGSSVASAVLIGNATQKAVTVTGTTIASANNI